MEEHVYGCLPAKKDLRDYKIKSKLCGAIQYPEEFQLSNLPKVKNQGQVQSCCAHATSSILEYYDKNRHKLSTNFIYGIQRKLFNQIGQGMYLVQACKIVQKYGDPLEKDCKGNTEVPNSWGIANNTFENTEVMTRAKDFRIISYYGCKTNDDIKFALMNNGPVLAAVNWHNDYKLTEGVIEFNLNSGGGGHAVMIYGWNKNGWLIQNSWGETFGVGGRFILPYKYKLAEAKALVDYANEENEELNVALVKPKNNKVFNIFYKGANKVINLFKK